MINKLKILMAAALTGSQLIPVGCSAPVENKSLTKPNIIWMIAEYIMIAKVLCHFGQPQKAVPVLGIWVQDDQPWLALHASRTILVVGDDAKPLIPEMKEVLAKNLADPRGKRKYKDAKFASFTSWALEWALQELGEKVKVN